MHMVDDHIYRICRDGLLLSGNGIWNVIVSLSYKQPKPFTLSAKEFIYKPVSKSYLTMNKQHPCVLSLPLVIIL